MRLYSELDELLQAVETELRALELWQQTRPSVEELASIQPFAVDKLSFNQWLQFIFLPRIRVLVTAQAPLPENCNVAPMAEEFLKREAIAGAALLEHLAAIDRLITQA
jgi:uncharacterized protein YqcC (DUF446 family)